MYLQIQVPGSLYRFCLTCTANHVVKIRRSLNSIIFAMDFYIGKTASWYWISPSILIQRTHTNFFIRYSMFWVSVFPMLNHHHNSKSIKPRETSRIIVVCIFSVIVEFVDDFSQIYRIYWNHDPPTLPQKEIPRVALLYYSHRLWPWYFHINRRIAWRRTDMVKLLTSLAHWQGIHWSPRVSLTNVQ